MDNKFEPKIIRWCPLSTLNNNNFTEALNNCLRNNHPIWEVTIGQHTFEFGFDWFFEDYGCNVISDNKNTTIIKYSILFRLKYSGNFICWGGLHQTNFHKISVGLHKNDVSALINEYLNADKSLVTLIEEFAETLIDKFMYSDTNRVIVQDKIVRFPTESNNYIDIPFKYKIKYSSETNSQKLVNSAITEFTKAESVNNYSFNLRIKLLQDKLDCAIYKQKHLQELIKKYGESVSKYKEENILIILEIESLTYQITHLLNGIKVQ